MDSIKPLPEALRSSVRSGVVLFDLTRVVEELVFNSLDAGATKVSVAVGLGTCYVKVVDDGSGVSRDGLVLLGERYATSKLHDLANVDATIKSFGFRGEALASIADVSLLEIVTKACGRPNGYRKVMKGAKCLYLGLDDDMKDVGTTVVVRDLFYNQPVRRKHMQSSPKKVLHLIKKCVLRIALVHSKVFFKVFDIESEDDLLYTRPCASPLSLLMSGFGLKDSKFLHELEYSDGILKLSGYVSGPYGCHDIKAFQYVYINSRFVCKGPIHKLLNNLGTRTVCLDQWKANRGSLKGKRSTAQALPAYMLNLLCPHSLYDLTFEPSKTFVEFKDWAPVLYFIEEAVQKLWRGSTYGEPLSHGADIFHKDNKWNEADNITSEEEEANEVKDLRQSLGVLHSSSKLNSVEDLEFGTRQDDRNIQDVMLETNGLRDDEKFENSHCTCANDVGLFEDFIPKETEESLHYAVKWRTRPQTTNNGRPNHIHDQNKILEISSGFFHLSGDLLFPKSINKNCLAGARVLHQVDKKFISIVAGGTLAVIDQHAADERIRLEELRRKVLSGEGKAVTFLDTEQELVLPEIGYQLLHNYADLIKDWGWFCSIHSQGSRSFKKNLNVLHQQPTLITLLAVPCILGVNLTHMDLQEFLEQLGDTDGASTIPPSVIRVLNFKACRGAIMFGDSLLPSECSLIVEELKQTSLCFQCAHGRPTTAPLVNMEAFQKQITKLGALEGDSNKPWHGLCRQEVSLERSAQRLTEARGF
ncbi:DNA mismatch repair protein MLH3 isoform X4 [Tripterygium wilfordii]|uniref:DNA mismatch repair protein MLH3 isoform X4 n=1 Tax=Tripterygium wilfordii TaxID=458696 RepID=UPI0018F82673|nr:DNA mismatch repair protein MLH3 isoform X4 [Tripterygium wilfordii]